MTIYSGFFGKTAAEIASLAGGNQTVVVAWANYLHTVRLLIGILLFSAIAGNAFAHIRPLFIIGGEQYYIF
jgi:hypothetical protein